mgnify:CR=1 FL=1|tara:strand:- start:3810 stop:5837 length:2028 start_codon:yes stop_codon:yes gene_type:complete
MAKKDDEMHALAVKRFERVETKERDQRRLAVEDIKFAQTEDGQWDEGAKEKRRNRPRFTINRVAGAIDQLIGDQRQNRTDIKIRPVSGGADEDIAKVYTGLIRNIESASKASNAYDCAFDEVVNGGFGGWRVTTEFNDDDAFDQDIRIKPLNTATTSLWFDDAAKEYDKRDANFAFVTVDMPLEEHKKRFPDSPMSAWSQMDFNSSSCQNWHGSDTIKVAEYWVKTPITKELALLSDGRVIDADEEASVLDELSAQGITVKRTRKVKSHKVEMYLMDGSTILEGPKQWAGKFIPLIPMYGRQSHIEGQTYTRGLVRFAKDASRIYNYEISSIIETSALTPKDPLWYTPAMAKGHEAKYRNFTTQNSPFMPYNSDPKAPGPPVRGGAPAVQQGSLSIIQNASMDIYHVTGMQPPSIGTNPELKSGKAIQAQERLGDRGQFIFTDNLVKSQEYCAEILLDLIPRIYDTERQVRIMAQDGESENVFINQAVRDEQTGENVLVNDLSVGKYDVTAESGPAFATQRQESAQQILDLIATSPMFENLAMDLVAKDLPILESKELTKRVRKLQIQQGIIEPTDEEREELGLNEPQEPDAQQEAVTTNIQLQTEKLISDIEVQEAKAQQGFIKLDNEMNKQADKFAMDLTELEQKMGVQLDNEVRNNVLVFDPAIGDFVNEGR